MTRTPSCALLSELLAHNTIALKKKGISPRTLITTKTLTKETPMKYYAGLDVSCKSTAVCIVDTEGTVLHQSTQVTDPQAIAQCLRKFGQPIEKAGVETGSLTRWLVLSLRELGINALAIDARAAKPFLDRKINKNDPNDSHGIADIMRTNSYKESHIKSDQSAERRVAIETRSTFVSQRTQAMNAIRGHLKSLGIRLGPFNARNIRERLAPVVSTLSAMVQASIQALIDVASYFDEEITKLDKVIERSVKSDSNVQLLQTVPGVGPITALAFIVEMDDLTRFNKSRDVAAYLGLTPRLYESGDRSVMGRISKRGNKSLRSLLVQAGFSILTNSQKWSKLKAWGLRISRKRGTNKAKVAVARKLATILYRMLEKGEPFRFTDKEPLARQANTTSTHRKEAA
jgi:transposase